MNGKDKEGCYYKWGNKGKKYYYTPGDILSIEEAKAKARRQAAAIKRSYEKNNQSFK